MNVAHLSYLWTYQNYLTNEFIHFLAISVKYVFIINYSVQKAFLRLLLSITCYASTDQAPNDELQQVSLNIVFFSYVYIQLYCCISNIFQIRISLFI